MYVGSNSFRANLDAIRSRVPALLCRGRHFLRRTTYPILVQVGGFACYADIGLILFIFFTRICRYMVSEDGEENVPHRVWFQIYERVLNEVKEELKKQGREDEFFGSKVIILTFFPQVPICRSTLTSCLYFRSFTRPCAMSPAKSSSGISKTVSLSSRSSRTWSQASTSSGMRTRSSRSSTTRSRS